MHLQLFFLLGCILLIGFIIRVIENNNEIIKLQKFVPGLTVKNQYFDFNDKFLNRSYIVKPVRLVKVYSQIDIILLRSMLDSAKIRTYLENDNMNTLYAGLAIPGYSDAFLSVEMKNLFDAKRIVREYLSKNRKNLRKSNKPEFRPIVEFIVSGYLVPSANTRNLPELLI